MMKEGSAGRKMTRGGTSVETVSAALLVDDRETTPMSRVAAKGLLWLKFRGNTSTPSL